MFRGRSYHKLDEKGRVSIPSRFRDPLQSEDQDQLMLTNLDSYLLAFPMPLWKEIEDKLNRQASFLDRKKQRFIRFFIGGAEPCSVDKAGRILIPPSLRDYADLPQKSEAVMVGMGNRFEIWNKNRYELDTEDMANGDIDDETRMELAECFVSS